MKPSDKKIKELRDKIAGYAKAKREDIAFFEKGGKLSDFNPKQKNIVRPF